MKKRGLVKIISKLMTFVTAAGLVLGTSLAMPKFTEDVYARDGSGDVVVVIDPGHGGYDVHTLSDHR